MNEPVRRDDYPETRRRPTMSRVGEQLAVLRESEPARIFQDMSGPSDGPDPEMVREERGRVARPEGEPLDSELTSGKHQR